MKRYIMNGTAIAMLIAFLIGTISVFNSSPVENRITNNVKIAEDINWEDVEVISSEGKLLTFRGVYHPGISPQYEPVLCLKSSWVELRIFADDELVYELTGDAAMNSACISWVSLKQYVGVEELRVEVTGYERYINIFLHEKAYYGEEDEVHSIFLNDRFYVIFFTISAILMIIHIAYNIILLHSKLGRPMIKTLGLLVHFIISVTVWLICDSGYLYIWTRNARLTTMLLYVSLMIFPLYMVMFVEGMTQKEHRELWLLARCLEIHFVLAILLDVSGIMRFGATIIVEHAIIMVGAPAMLKVVIYEWRNNANRIIKKLLIGFLVCIGFAIIAIGLFYNHSGLSYAKFYSVAFYFMLAVFIICAYEMVSHVLEEESHMQMYKEMALKDAETGLANRMAFRELQQEPLTKSEAYVVMDINDLKKTNDTYGHAIGDLMIKEAARRIQEIFPTGECFRIGGDEFVVVAPCEHEMSLTTCMERLQIENDTVSPKPPFQIKIAYGYAIASKGDSRAEVLKKADDAMYACKRSMKKKEIRKKILTNVL